jgi:hypothetical protein
VAPWRIEATPHACRRRTPCLASGCDAVVYGSSPSATDLGARRVDGTVESGLNRHENQGALAKLKPYGRGKRTSFQLRVRTAIND